MHIYVPYFIRLFVIRIGFQNLKLTMENDHVSAYLEQISSSHFPYSIHHEAQIFNRDVTVSILNQSHTKNNIMKSSN